MGLMDNIKIFFEMLNSEVFKVSNQMKDIERRLNWKINKIKKGIKYTFFYLMFMLITIVFLSAGLIIFLNRFFPLDVIFLVLGTISAIIALIYHVLE